MWIKSLAAIGVEEFIWQDRLRLVPYRGVNRNTQFMLAIKPDKVVINHNDSRLEATKGAYRTRWREVV